MITRDGEDHYTFVENATEQRKAERRNPSIYMGQWINVKRRADGTVYPTFKRTKGIGAGKLGDYAVSTTCELLMVASSSPRTEALERRRTSERSNLQADGERTEVFVTVPPPSAKAHGVTMRKHGLRSVSTSQRLSAKKDTPTFSSPLYISI